MQKQDLLDLLKNPIIQSLIASLIFAISNFLVKFIYRAIKSVTNSFAQENLHKLSIFLYFSYVIALGLTYINNILSLEAVLLSFSIVSFFNIVFLYKYIFRLRKIGIVGSDLNIVNGFSYLQTIKASKTDFRFLGVGARKLTLNEPDFEKMVERVSKNGNHVRLLLCHPNSDALTYLATRANKSPDDYSHKVSSSLKYLAKLVNDKNYEISIRFYHSDNVHDMPIFRLVFINSTYCLTSYTQFNDSTHEGHLMPQIHFSRTTKKDASNSFYFGFETYFERLWEQNELNSWSPDEFL